MEYKEFGAWLQAELGCKAQKISVDAGFSCPNRDGTVGFGGCTFCDNRTLHQASSHVRKSFPDACHMSQPRHRNR